MQAITVPTTLRDKLHTRLPGLAPLNPVTHPFEAAVSVITLGFASTGIARLWILLALVLWGGIVLLVSPIEISIAVGALVAVLLIVGRRYVILHGEQSGRNAIAACRAYFTHNATAYPPTVLRSIQTRISVRLAALQVGVGLPLLTVGALFTIYSTGLKSLTLPTVLWAGLAILFLLSVDSYLDSIQQSNTYTILYDAAEEHLQAGPPASDPQVLACLTVQVAQAEKIGRLEAQVAQLQAGFAATPMAVPSPDPTVTAPQPRRSLLRLWSHLRLSRK